MPRSHLPLALLLVIWVASCDSHPTGATRSSPSAPTSVAASSPAPEHTPSAPPTRAVTATATDPTGDVEDPDGNPPPGGGAAADLTSVTLRRDGDGLTVRFEVAGPVPASADSLLWSLELEGEPGYAVGAQLTGGELNAGIYDRRRDVQHTLETVKIDGATITVYVPAGELDELGPTFDWSALTQLDGAYEDRTGTTVFPGSPE